ncbi:CBS domain-containing protein [Amycolatopsis sp. CA-230715]|uniref:CBS domain-containing protein n=1 Tax=Amycolatopsis sp. CA-230715 TaxID=2745196 RepID=UPI001C018BC0|nr:CBS domain-containing protein [Amycolatopsis sp. CA-230715]
MKDRVATVHPDTSLKAIAVLLASWGVSGAPVVEEDGTVVGVVSQGDLLRRKAAHGRFRIAGAALRRKETGSYASDLMTAPAVTVGRDEDVSRAARLMEERRVHRLPVVDEDGKLVGVVARGDLLRVFLRSDNDIRAEVRDQVLLRDMCVDPDSLSVAVHDGVVSLRGQVERSGMIPVVTALVRGVDGVVAVHEYLTARFEDTAATDTGDENVGILSARKHPR